MNDDHCRQKHIAIIKGRCGFGLRLRLRYLKRFVKVRRVPAPPLARAVDNTPPFNENENGNSWPSSLAENFASGAEVAPGGGAKRKVIGLTQAMGNQKGLVFSAVSGGFPSRPSRCRPSNLMGGGDRASPKPRLSENHPDEPAEYDRFLDAPWGCHMPIRPGVVPEGSMERQSYGSPMECLGFIGSPRY